MPRVQAHRFIHAARVIFIAIALLLPLRALADTPALCSFSSGVTNLPPSGQVAVTILSMDLNSDMEDEDDYIPGYDDRADVFGKIEINADGTPESFGLPKIDENDHPHWTDGNLFVSRAATIGNLVHVTIRLRESDWEFDDTVDTSPDPARDDLEFDFNTCSLTVSGDVTGSASAPFEVKSGTGWNQGVLRFQVGMADGRALSDKGDVVLAGFDLVQVLPQSSRLVALKPTVGLVTVANNTAAPQPVSVRLRVVDAVNTVLYDGTESLGTPLGVGEVRSKYLATATPVLPTDFSCKDSQLLATATLVLPPGAETSGDPKTACWLINNTSGIKSWNVVSTRKPALTWIRTGALLDIGALASMSQVNGMHDLALPFIRGLYPTAAVDDSVSTFPLVPPLSGGVYALVASLLVGLGVPADAVTPYLIVYELNADAALAGIDRLMGVLPKAWFKNTLYGIWSSTTGLSLGEWHPHAVIFEAEGRNDEATVEGPRLTLPGHELGHTFGLSTDPTIKSWACTLSGDLGIIACGIGGGFDEYHSVSHPDGVPTWGYWVPQSSGALAGLTGEQCNSNCLMGPNSMNAQDNWVTGEKEWIDPADYDQVIDRLKTCGPSAKGTLYVSGVIAGDDSAVLGWTFAQPSQSRLLDFAEKPAETPSAYGIVLLDAKGTTLSEAELPLNWNLPDTQWPIEATFFGGTISFPVGTATIQVWNRVHKKLLVERAVSARAPSVSAPVLGTHVDKKTKQRFLDVSWSAKDPDGDALTHFVQVSPDRGQHWWPVAHALDKPASSINLADVRSGSYLVRIVSTDGVNVTMSQSAIAL
jgi:hypothetical protein